MIDLSGGNLRGTRYVRAAAGPRNPTRVILTRQTLLNQWQVSWKSSKYDTHARFHKFVLNKYRCHRQRQLSATLERDLYSYAVFAVLIQR